MLYAARMALFLNRSAINVVGVLVMFICDEKAS